VAGRRYAEDFDPFSQVCFPDVLCAVGWCVPDESMINLIFCLLAFLFLAVGRRLMKKASPYSRSGGDTYALKRKRKTLGQTLWAVAGLLLVLALVNFFYSLGPATVSDASLLRSAVPYQAPVLPPTSSDVAKARAAFSPSMLNEPATNDLAGEMAPSLSPPSTSHADTWGGSSGADAGPSTASSAAPPDPGMSVVNDDGARQLDSAMDAANATIQKDPSNFLGYIMRGNVYGKRKQWDQASQDYRHALAIDSKCVPALFNLAQIDFMQMKYETARSGFVALQEDADLGDLARYSVFLCDLVGGHRDVATKELEAFNQAGSNASYYFANVAWLLNQRKEDEARDWMQSAVKIYSPTKVHLYATPLVELGYLSKTPPPSAN